MLTSKQRAFLRKEAAMKTPELQVGKGEVGEDMFREMDNLLRTRELVKVSVLRTAEGSAYELADRFAGVCAADVVQVIGRRFVLYRHSRELAQKGKALLLPR